MYSDLKWSKHVAQDIKNTMWKLPILFYKNQTFIVII